jgi:hypothetical protein
VCQECMLPACEEEEEVEEEDRMGRFTCDVQNLMCKIRLSYIFYIVWIC